MDAAAKGGAGMSDKAIENVCPQCGDAGPFEQTTVGYSLTVPDGNYRICTCGHRWKTAERLAWEAARDADEEEGDGCPCCDDSDYEAEQEREEQLRALAVACAGAPFVTEFCPGEGLHFFSQSSGPTLKGVPNCSVLLLPDGQAGIVTEKNVTRAMRVAIEDAAEESSSGILEWSDESMLALHTRLVAWLRRQWAIGRIRREVDGTWDLLPAVRAP
jgi:hypothetical protein